MAMTRLPLAVLDAMSAKPSYKRPHRTLGFRGRSEMMAIWDSLDADKQTLLLELAREMAKAEGRPEGDGPAIRTGNR